MPIAPSRAKWLVNIDPPAPIRAVIVTKSDIPRSHRKLPHSCRFPAPTSLVICSGSIFGKGIFAGKDVADFQGGQIVPKTGSYRVTHELAHVGALDKFTFIRGRHFPMCPHCGTISYELLQAHEWQHRSRRRRRRDLYHSGPQLSRILLAAFLQLLRQLRHVLPLLQSRVKDPARSVAEPGRMSG